MLSLHLHLHPLPAGHTLVHGAGAGALLAEEWHELLVVNLPKLEAADHSHFLVGSSLRFDKHVRHGALENLAPRFDQRLIVQEGEQVAFFGVLGDRLEEDVLRALVR